MKVLGLVFSARKEGNCLKCLAHCLDSLRGYGAETEIVNAFEFTITPCSHCDYECFSSKKCPITDDVPALYEKCEHADVLICAVPTYSGHLSSLYFAFAERSQPMMEDRDQFVNILRKVNFIVLGNLSSGGDMALHEALYGLAHYDFWPEVLLFPAEEYGRSSIKGDLIEIPEVRTRLDRFAERIARKTKNLQDQTG